MKNHTAAPSDLFFDINLAAQEFPAFQRRQASGVERLPEGVFDFARADDYKIGYRSCAILSCYDDFIIPHLNGQILLLDQAKQLLGLAHPYYGWLFDNRETLERFRHTFWFIYGANHGLPEDIKKELDLEWGDSKLVRPTSPINYPHHQYVPTVAKPVGQTRDEILKRTEGQHLEPLRFRVWDC